MRSDMDKNYYMQQSIDTDGVAPVYNPSRVQTSPHGAFNNAPMGINVGQYFNNNTIDSKYTEDLGDVNAAVRAGRTVEDLLAEKQSGWEMAGNALLNNVVIAGTSLVTGTLGVVDGILEASANGDPSRLWNNSVDNWATNVQDAAKELFPIYRGEEYNNASIWEKMGTGVFWADLVENLGYIEGMLIPGMAASKIFQGLGKLGKGATMLGRLGSAFVSSMGEAAIEAINERNDEVKNKTAIANQRYNELASQANDSELPKLYDDYLKTIQDIEDDANNAGNFTFGTNLALLTLTNTVEFGNLFSRGFSTSRKIAGRLTRDGEKYIAENSTKAIAKSVGKKVVAAFTEGMEEVSQAAISGTSQYYTDYNKFNESIFNPDKRELVGNLISAFGESYANTLQDPQTAEEFASGFITGLVGVPQLRKTKIPIKMENNIIGDIYDTIKKNRREQELAKNINDRLLDSKQFNAYYEGLVRHLALQDDINTAIDEADHTAFDNATSAQLISDIIMFDNAGHLNHLKELVNNSIDLSDEGVNAIIEETSKDGNGPFINNGNKIDVDETRELIKRKQDYINYKIDFISKTKSELEAAFPELNESGLENAIFLRSQIEDHQTRFNSLKDNVRAGIANLFNSYINNETPRKVLKGGDLSETEANPYKKLIPTENELLANLNNPVFGEIVQDLLNSDNSAMPHNEKVKLSEDIRDLGKLQAGIVELNKNLAEALKNPNKTNSSRQEALNRKERVNKASRDIKIKDKIDNADVSEIVHGMESGGLDEGQLDGLFSEEDNEFLNNVGTEGQPQPSGRQKVEEAKKIIKTSQRMDGAIAGLNDGSIGPQAIADARTLLQHSKEVSNSTEELLDTNTQAFNDPNNLVVEFDEAVQAANQEELEAILGERIDAAKSVIERAKAVLSEQNAELDDLPEGAPVVRESTPEEAQGKETGHDATEHTPTENERQKAEAAQRAAQALNAEEQAKVNNLFQDLKESMSQENVGAFDKAVSEVLKSIDKLIGAKATSQEIEKLVKNTQSYQIAKQLAPELDDYLNVYVTSRLNPKAAEPAKQEEEPKIATPVITDQEVRQQTTAQRTVDPNQGEFTGTYQYWKPTTSYLPFGRAYAKGDNTPFYKIARTLKNQDGTPAYSEPTLRRIEAVGKHLEEHGAFKLVDSGAVKVGSNVHFTIDSTLNDQAGELVILMTDDQGRVIGDVMSSTDPRFANQLGLPQLVERITAEYKEAGSPQHFTSKEVTTVDKNMVGKIPYLADHEVMHTLNEVFVDGEQQVPFKIGVAANSGKNARILASAGRTKKQGQSDLERSINPPLTAKAGQPFLLLPTSSSVNAYMTVPIIMDSYSPATQGTALGKAIHKVLERILPSDNAHVMGIINDLEELLSVQEIHINYNGDNVKVTIKPNGAEHQMTIYNGAKNAPNIVEQLELGLQGQPFQVSRKYMNEDYDGQDYNRMIGEVAKVNLPIGTTHTVSDWFTIKPINAAGQKMKTKSPRSTGSNPHAATPQYITITKKGMALNVNPATWEVTDSTGKVYIGPNTNKVKAQAFGMYMNKNMEQPYDTEWGYYDPKTDEFVEKPNRVLRTLGEPQQGTVAKGVTITNPHTKKSYTIRVGETRRIDDGMYPGVSTIKDIQDDGIIVDSYYDETSGTTTTRFSTQDQYLTELSYATLVTNPSTATESSAELKDKAKKAGLLSNKVREALWARLTPEQQSIIVNKKGPKQKQWMDALETAFDPATNTFDETKLKGTVDEFLGRKGMYRKTDGSQGVFNKQRELSWMQKALPQLSTKEHLEFIDRLIEVVGSKDGEVAWGKFQNGLITISDLAAGGTLYHEAFHAVTHMLLNEMEYQKLFDAAVKRWGDIDRVQLEENLAEDFRRYMQSEEDWYDNLQEKGYGPLRKSIATIFHKLKNLCKALFGKNVYMNRLYSNISRGKYADRKVKTYDSDNPDIRYRYNDRIDSLEHEIAQIDRDIQSIRSQRKAATQNKIAQKWETINGEKYAKISNTGYLSEYSALQDIPNEYRDIITSFESYGRHYLYLKSKEESAWDIEELRQEQDRLKQRLERLKANKWDLISNEALQDQEAHYRVIDQYHRDKYMYGNLSQEDRDYLQERGITPQEFSQMTQLEKEVLFHCKY